MENETQMQYLVTILQFIESCRPLFRQLQHLRVSLPQKHCKCRTGKTTLSETQEIVE